MSIRAEYHRHGVKGYYTLCASSYKNPHLDIVQELVKEHCSSYKHVLDLACGTGEVSSALPCSEVVGIDPYLWAQYERNTKKPALRLSFKEIAVQGLQGHFDAIICSFALHLCSGSVMPMLLYQLAQVSDTLIVISPSKFPAITYWWLEEIHLMKDSVHFRKFSAEKIS